MNKIVSLNTVKFPNLDIQHYKKLSTPRYLNTLSIATINHHIRYDILRKAYLKRIIALKLKIKEHKDQESDLTLTGLNKNIDHHIAILNQSIIPNLKYLSSKELQDMVKLTIEESLITDKEFVIKFAEDLQSYNLKEVVDSIIPYEKYPQREAVNFLEGLKCSYKTSTGNLYKNVSEKLIKHFETVTTETKHINKAGEELSSTRYAIKYDKLLSINKINEELFTKPELQNFITTFVHFCPVEHLDPLVYYFKENIVKSFSNEAHVSVMTAVLQRLSLEQYRYGESLRFLGMNNNNNRAKNVGYKTLLSKADLAEVKYSRAFVDKFKKNLVGKILINMEINPEAKKEFLKQNGVINKSDVLTYYNMYFGDNKDLIEFVKTRENKFDLISERSFLELLPKD
ncbi:hypothetical protein HANVADRAFT_54431 [Hanseniaspora valbyensis NRRL Y-1626]|uniref:Uncharacterized protein n=1 Tax=Hanseniaspora valbyensis NRRL Y-1626 TaxID=766949 RepID=A0A1B7SAE9_9ASCO|nr:hypothetical protein HANVADRAFT_54431 [Hanseniaspora valbyensis NRRL Y-1626]